MFIWDKSLDRTHLSAKTANGNAATRPMTGSQYLRSGVRRYTPSTHQL